MERFIGKMLDGRYEIKEIIGVGGMAVVFKAKCHRLNRYVAIKILKDEYMADDELRRQFHEESQAVAMLSHPNIMAVYDVSKTEELEYIVMELIDGITLKEYLERRGPLSSKEVTIFSTQIAKALEHAHSREIIHRDIKPQNIMLLSDGTIKVTDFGIARLTRSELKVTAVGDKAIGSVHYISPEQARGEITDEKADIYSVGIMLYEMLTGKLPFEADNAVSVAIMQMQSEATLPHEINADIPEGLEQITMKAMQKDSTKRYQSAAEMLSDIDEFTRNPSIKFEYTYLTDNTPTRYVDAITRVRGTAETENVEEESDETGRSRVPLIAILGIVAAFVVIAAVGISIFVSSLMKDKKEEMTVDNFVGMSYTDEVSIHENIRNYTIELQSGYHAEYPEGYVYNQDPAPDTRIKVKGKLILYISMGAREETVPTMTPGENANLVRSRLEKAGFVVKEAEESSKDCKKGSVIRLTPEPGSKVQYGTEVTMYISSGEPAADPIDMPNVTSLEVGSAIDALVAAGFDRNKIKVEYVNYNAKKDAVISMTPDYTVQQLPDVNIILTVSTGYQDVALDLLLPDVSGAVDLQFYVAGKHNAALTSQYQGILPVDVGSIHFTVTEPKSSYVVRVSISKSGKNAFKDYAVFQINGETGAVESVKYYDFVEDTTTSSSTTTTGSTGTSSTTQSTSSTTQVDDDTTTTSQNDDASNPTDVSDVSNSEGIA